MKTDNPAGACVARAASGRAPLMKDAESDKALKLTLEAARSNATVVLHCQGRVIFLSDARSLSGLIMEVLPAAYRIVVDLAGVISLDSDALGELVLTHMWAEAAGYQLKFACPSEPVRRLFETTNLVAFFDLYGSVPEALAAMKHEEVQAS